MVVAPGPAGGEGVAQPEAPLPRQLVGRVGEGGGALVGGHHQVGVLAVPDGRLRGVDHPAVLHVVGEVQEPLDELAIALHAPTPRGLRPGGRVLRDERPLGPGGHDDGVLDLLGLHQPQHLHPEVLAPVAPADPPPGHRVHPQVRPLGAAAVDVDLVARPGLRHHLDAPAVELEGHETAAALPRPPLEEVGARRRLDEVQQPPVGPVVLDAPHLVQRLVEAGRERPRVRPGGPGAVGCVERLEDAEEEPRRLRVQGQRRPDAGTAGDGAHTEGEAGVRPEQRRLPPRQAGGEDERVERVVLRVPLVDGPEHPGHAGLRLLAVDPPAGGGLRLEGVDRERGLPAAADVVLVRLQDTEAEVLQRGHEVAEDVHPPGGEHLHHGRTGPLRGHGLQGELLEPALLERLQALDVLHRRVDVDGGLVLGGELPPVPVGEGMGPPGVVAPPQRVREALLPAPDGRPDALLEPLDVHVPHFLAAGAEVEVEPGLVAAVHGEVVVEELAPVRLQEDLLDGLPDLLREALPRQHDHDVDATGQGVPPGHHPHLVGALGLHHGPDHLEELRHRGQEELLLGHAVEDLDDPVVVVRPLHDVLGLQDLPQLAAEDRDRGSVLRVGLRGEEAQEATLPLHLAVRAELLHAQVVHPRPAVDRGLGVGLGDDEERPAHDAGPQVRREIGHPLRLGEPGLALVPEDAEPRPLADPDPPLPLLVVPDVVLAVAQEDEGAVLQPREELADLLQLRGPPGRPLLDTLQAVHHVAALLQHRLEVVGGLADLREAVADLPLQRPRLRRAGALHHHVDDGAPRALAVAALHLHHVALLVAAQDQDRVQEVDDVEALPVDVLPERVHDEGAVRHDRLDHEPVGPPREGAHPDADLAGGRLPDEAEEGDDLFRRPGGVAPLQEVGRGPGQELPGEVLDEVGRGAGPLRVEGLHDLVDPPLGGRPLLHHPGEALTRKAGAAGRSGRVVRGEAVAGAGGPTGGRAITMDGRIGRGRGRGNGTARGRERAPARRSDRRNLPPVRRPGDGRDATGVPWSARPVASVERCLRPGR